ncbi:LacI family transcriptional regulator [Tersicoccus solisilvae]|uniref:LacI family transcriptional regulator n=1 Tax=Tersicoccus solisilvae TaxID=1882339 RepID=A0ABQ1P9M7_9MICC|nr:LacI family DNA-binding transcriptional regulator [Tersicoccus solisilvae]GGC93374.1 LacI family transcriptional regulator [Tersicoccus solisilvae]
MTEDGPLPAADGAAPTDRVTIYDVARAAGVAPSTVSRAFARPGRVTAATAEKVRRAAEQVGYRPEMTQRRGPTARPPARTIALLVADITNPVFIDIIRGAEEAVTAAGYTLLLANTQESDRLERSILERVLDSVDGLLLTSSRMSDAGIRLIARQKPTVVLNRFVTGVPCVVGDATGIRHAAELFAAAGRSRVAYLAGPEASWANGVRWRALVDAAPGLGLRPRQLGPFAPDIAGGEAAAAAWLARPTPAVLAYNDLMAIGFQRAVLAAGVRVPEDVAVVGFDDSILAGLVVPALSSIATPLARIGATAVHHLLALERGSHPAVDRPVLLPTRLVERRSTPARPADAAG